MPVGAGVGVGGRGSRLARSGRSSAPAVIVHCRPRDDTSVAMPTPVIHLHREDRSGAAVTALDDVPSADPTSLVLADTTEELGVVLELMHEPCLVIDGNTREVGFANQGACRLFGSSAAQLCGRDFLELGPAKQSDGGESAARFDALVRRAIDERSVSFPWAVTVPGGVHALREVTLVRVIVDWTPLLVVRVR